MKLINKKLSLGIAIVFLIAFFTILSLNLIKSEYINSSDNNSFNQSNSTNINNISNQPQCIGANYIQVSEDCREEQSSYFINQLNLPNDSIIDNELLNSFIERKQNDSLNLINIFRLSLNIDENQRLFLAKDLLSFDRDFIERFVSISNKDSTISENIKSQINNYTDDISINKTFKLNISDEKIENLYSNNNSTDFINNILN